VLNRSPKGAHAHGPWPWWHLLVPHTRVRLAVTAAVLVAVVGTGVVVAHRLTTGDPELRLAARDGTDASIGLSGATPGPFGVTSSVTSSGGPLSSATTGVRPSAVAATPLASGNVTAPDAGGPSVASVGFSAGDLSQLGRGDLEDRLADMQRMGVGWIRLDFSWTSVQHDGPDQYDWEIYDRVIPAIRRHGMNVLGLLAHSPGWAGTQGCSQGQDCSPRDPGQFAAFAANAARRYKGQGVRTWEVWNEPNLPASWGPAPNPGRYVTLLRAAAPAIKAVDPGALVMTGGLGVTYSEGQRISAADFLAGVYDAGGRGYFDAVAHHPYSYPAEPSSTQDWSGWAQMLQVRKVMVSHGDSGKPLWATEFGAPTSGPGAEATQSRPNLASHPDHVSESFQATLAQLGIAAHDKYSWMGPLFWYGYKDLGSASGTNENFFGLVRQDGSHKPAYDVFVGAVGRSSTTTPLSAAG
jgi:polysaccharide biosynthesis protein PslG